MHLFIYSLALYGFSVVAASRATLFCKHRLFITVASLVEHRV